MACSNLEWHNYAACACTQRQIETVREAKDLPDEVERKVIYGIVVRILYCYWTNYYF